MRRLMLTVPLAIGLCSCSKTPEDIRAGIVADTSITDQQAIDQLAGDIYKYAVPQDSFDPYLNTGSAMEIAKGGAKGIIERTCIVEYDHFDKLQYTEVE